MTTPNLDALAKLAPFIADDLYAYPSDEFTLQGGNGSVVYLVGGKACHDIAAALNEWADLRAYRERTEDSMRRISEYWARKEALAGVHSLRCFGLWREPGQGATDGK